MKDWNIIKELKWKLFMWKIRLWGYSSEQKDKHYRKKFCRHGFHKIRSGSIGWGGSDMRMRYVRYLNCVHCNYLFFAKKSDKEYYQKKNKQDKEIFSALLSKPLES